MPELPEVETTRRGLAPHLEGAVIEGVVIRCPRLRWPIPENLPELLSGQSVVSLRRRAKYLLLECGNEHGTIATPDDKICHTRLPHPTLPPYTPPLQSSPASWRGSERERQSLIPAGEGANESLCEFHVSGTLILHLGMSGSLRILPAGSVAEKHDHFDLQLNNGHLMRLRDPRRFGAVLWHKGEIHTHPLLSGLGPEPLEEDAGLVKFDAHYLYERARGRQIAIKQFIMDNHVVAGIGNIYACEALFSAGISPLKAACRLSMSDCARLVDVIRTTLSASILVGGSTLRDFVNASGNPGYFQQQLWVYGREGEPCRVCLAPIQQIKQGQRSSFYCANCQAGL